METPAQPVSRLQEAIESLPVIDVHTHLNPARPQGKDLTDVLLYHHLSTELVSAGMPATRLSQSGLPHEVADPEIPPRQRLEAALPYLSRIRNTTVGGFARTILRDLYQVPGGELTADNFARVWAEAAERARDSAWAEEVLRNRCRIVHSFTVEPSRGEGDPRFSFVSEAFNRFFLPHKTRDYRQAMEELDRVNRQEVVDAGTLKTAVDRVVMRQGREGALGMAFWLPADFHWAPADETAVTAALQRIRAGEGAAADRDLVATFAFRHALHLMPVFALHRAQLFFGAEVTPPHRSIAVASGQFARELAPVFREFEDLDFELVTASPLHTHAACILAKHFPSVRVAGYWWHTLYPGYIREAIEARFDIVPGNKITAFFSDAYTCEWCYPKVKLVKRLLAEVLADRVRSGDYSEDYAVDLARQVLHDNPREFYRVGDDH